ncbi:MAG: phosphatase PAP2 family protein [Sphingomicrobium sp.]
MAGVLFVGAGLVGGPGFVTDIDAIHSLAANSNAKAGLTNGAVMLTQLGSVQGLFAGMLLAIALLANARRWSDLISLVGIVIGGRLAIELVKLAIDRPRPSFTPYPVEVHSLSFPSGHAGNSMITFLAIALLAAPARWRGRAVALAIVASIAIGLTRPFLGVHWPSDIVGGWAFGIGWVVALAALSRRWRPAAE